MLCVESGIICTSSLSFSVLSFLSLSLSTLLCPPAEGQDALIVACENERYMVVAGTFEKLVEQLACEEKPGQSNNRYSNMFSLLVL